MPMRQLSVQVAMYKKLTIIGLSTAFNTEPLVHTEQQIINDLKVTIIKQFKQDNQRLDLHKKKTRIEKHS